MKTEFNRSNKDNIANTAVIAASLRGRWPATCYAVVHG